MCLCLIEAVHGGGIITLRLRHEQESTGASVILDIEDNGPGIPGKVLESLFEPFVRGDKPKPHAGLGLSVCKHIVQAHGGSISCESAPGRTLFSVRLPEQGPPDSASARILAGTEVFHGQT